MRRSKRLLKAFLPLFLLGLLLVCCWPVFRVLLDRQALLAYFCRSMGAGRVAAFLGTHVLATCLGVPGTVLVVVGARRLGCCGARCGP